MLLLDGSQGEGGGQILRTALALSLVTAQPFRIVAIRAGRQRPGLLRQHVAAVRAATMVGDAAVEGDSLGSRELTFVPRRVTGGTYACSVGSAGSATLVLQTVLPALVTAPAPSIVTIEGGTHNPAAPPFEFLSDVLLPLLARIGGFASVRLDRRGFYPAGGGRIVAEIRGNARLGVLDLIERGAILETSLRAIVSRIRPSVAHREVDAFLARVPWDRSCARSEIADDSHGPGNVLLARVASSNVTELFVGFGERGVPSEVVAQRVAAEVERYVRAGVPVGEHLADQLMLPMALGRGGTFRTLRPTQHARTQADVIARFLDVQVRFEPRTEDDWIVHVDGAGR